MCNDMNFLQLLKYLLFGHGLAKCSIMNHPIPCQARTDGYSDCRYAVFDFKFTCSRVGAGASKMDKIVFLQLSVFCRVDDYGSTMD